MPAVETSSSGGTDLSLLERVKDRDPEAWRQFVQLYGPMIFAWARRFGMPEHDAADVTQETMLAVSRAIGGFQRTTDGATLRGWLWTIARNKARDVHRRRRNIEQTTDGSPDDLGQLAMPERKPDDSDPAESRELLLLLHRGLAQVQGSVEQRTWQAFWLTVVDARDTDEVAESLGMTSNHVRQCRSRVLRRLRDLLGDVAV